MHDVLAVQLPDRHHKLSDVKLDVIFSKASMLSEHPEHVTSGHEGDDEV